MSVWHVKPRGCKSCGSTAHSAFTCPWKPRKRLNKRGPVAKKWLQTRDKWLEVNKAEYYICFYCPRVMTRSQLTLDHYKSRGRHPELRYVLSNLVPCCLPCNQEKGSLDGDEFMKLKRADGDKEN